MSLMKSLKQVSVVTEPNRLATIKDAFPYKDGLGLVRGIVVHTGHTPLTVTFLRHLDPDIPSSAVDLEEEHILISGKENYLSLHSINAPVQALHDTRNLCLVVYSDEGRPIQVDLYVEAA
jgi:hypothetical protein